jgi:protein NrfC
MSCSRRHFIAGMGAVIFMTGSDRPVFAKEAKIDGVRYGMVHDETRCIGCNACSEACREVNHVPEGVSRLTIIRTGPIGEFPDAKYHFFRHSCQHCDNPPCVSVCPTGASYKDPTTGIVDVDKDRCVGCQYCVAACPYRVRFIHPVNKTPDKCNFCRDTNLAAGKLPACVLSCPTKALTFGNLDDANSEINQLLASKLSYRSKVPLGTKPKLYRIPFQRGEIKE